MNPVYLDPVSDQLLRIIVALAAEVYTLRDRQRILEEVLSERGIVRREDIERYAPDDPRAWREDRDAFVARLFDALTLEDEDARPCSQ